MSRLIERVEKLEQTFARMEQNLSQMMAVAPMVQMLGNKAVGIEQAVAQLGKLLSAVSEELTDEGVVSGNNIIARLRKTEDAAARNQIQGLTAQGVIALESAGTQISDTSLVVVEQKSVSTSSGEESILSECLLIGMGSPSTDPEHKAALTGKTAGDSVTATITEDYEEVLTVKEVYRLVDRDVAGDTPDMTSETAEQDAPQDETLSFDDGVEEETEEAGA